jgi:hypothetical protein
MRAAHNVREWQSRAQPFKAVAPARMQAADRRPSTVSALPVAFADRAVRASLGAEGDQKAGAEGQGGKRRTDTETDA